jgi:antitoxin CptB
VTVEIALPDAGQGQVRWRCRRGMKELDLLLVRWLDAGWPAANGGQRAAFLRILEEPDPQLADWLLHGHRPADLPTAALLDDIISRRT